MKKCGLNNISGKRLPQAEVPPIYVQLYYSSTLKNLIYCSKRIVISAINIINGDVYTTQLVVYAI